MSAKLDPNQDPPAPKSYGKYQKNPRNRKSHIHQPYPINKLNSPKEPQKAHCKWRVYGCTTSGVAKFIREIHQDQCRLWPLNDPLGEATKLYARFMSGYSQSSIVHQLLGRCWSTLTPITVTSGFNQDKKIHLPFICSTNDLYPIGLSEPELLRSTLADNTVKLLGVELSQRLFKMLSSKLSCTSESNIKVLNVTPSRKYRSNLEIRLPKNITVRPETPQQVTWNICTSGSFTDLHVDRGLSTVTWPINGSKIWILWPLPLPARWYKLWAKQCSGAQINDSLFAKLASVLHNPHIVLTEENTGLYLPPQWLHVVFTLSGGYLGGLTWVHNGGQTLMDTTLEELEALQALEENNDSQNQRQEITESLNLIFGLIGQHLARTTSTNKEDEIFPEAQFMPRWFRLQTIMKKFGLQYPQANKLNDDFQSKF